MASDSNIWYQSARFFNPLPAVISPQQIPASLLLKILSSRSHPEKRKTFTDLHFTKLNHCCSRLVGCTSPRYCNHSKWALLTTSDSIVLHQARRHLNRSLDAIHTFVVTTCGRLSSREQPQSVLHSVERHSGGAVGSVPFIVVVIWSRIGLDNQHMIWNQ